MRETIRKQICDLMDQNMSSWQIASKTGLKESSAKEYMRQIAYGKKKKVKKVQKIIPVREPLLYDTFGDKDGFCYTVVKIEKGIIYIKRNDLPVKAEAKTIEVKYNAFMKGETRYRLRSYAPVKVIKPLKTVTTPIGEQVCLNI